MKLQIEGLQDNLSKMLEANETLVAKENSLMGQVQ